MNWDPRQSLLRTVYTCQDCPESFGFSRPGAGRPYFKFPPTIGAIGPAELLFVGINPRLAGNEALHGQLMASAHAFEDLAQNWDGRQVYIARRGPEPHYRMHIEIVEGVFGSGASFEEHAAVTELFFCASADSGGLPLVESPCADKHFDPVLQMVTPKVVICVGSRVFKYFWKRHDLVRKMSRLRYGQAEAAVVLAPHPNARMSGEQRRGEIAASVVKIRAALEFEVS